MVKGRGATTTRWELENTGFRNSGIVVFSKTIWGFFFLPLLITGVEHWISDMIFHIGYDIGYDIPHQIIELLGPLVLCKPTKAVCNSRVCIKLYSDIFPTCD